MTRFPPELLERYEYLNLLGKGGMGIVYLARDLVLGRTVAIKTLSSAAATESQLIRFQKEARAAAKLNHDHIVRVIDFGIMKNGDPYMVMDYVQGSDLNEYLKAPERNQKLLLVLDLAIQIVGALAHAHGQGVVHRDLKSANIVVTEDDDGEPRAMVIDFGIAQLSTLAVPADNTLFESTGNAVIGSPGYISPESIKADRVDFRTDIYSFGCVFFEMLTGKLPFIGETALATMEMHVKAIVPSVVPFELRLLEAPLSEEIQECFDTIIRRCMAKDPGKRYPSMGLLAEDLLEARSKILEVLEVIDLQAEINKADAQEQGPLLNLPWTAGFVKNRAFMPVVALLVLSISAILVMLFQSQQSAKVDERLAEDIKIIGAKQYPYLGEALKVTPDGYIPGDFRRTDVEDADLIAGDFKITGGDLDLKYSRVTDKGIAALDLTGVKKIVLDSTGITDKTMFYLAKFPSLKEIYADNTKITDKGVEAVAALPLLESIKLEGTLVTDDGIRALAHAPKLYLLDIAKCSKVSKASLVSIKAMPLLSRIRITKTAIRLRDLKDMNGLARITDEYSDLTQADIDALLRMKGLRRITLTAAALTEDQFMSLTGIPELHMLNVARCGGIGESQANRFMSIRDDVFVQWTLPYKKTYPADFSFKRLMNEEGSRAY